MALYKDTGEYDTAQEDEVRAAMELWADYAEDGPTFDLDGKYLCGTCNMRLGDDGCSRVVTPISFEIGSCRIYTIGESKDETPMPQKFTQIEVAYTERPKVKGYGCGRCEFGGEAKEADDDGRKGWCKFFGVHVEPLACCFKNTGDDDVLAPVEGNKDQTEKSMLPVVAKTTSLNEKEFFCPLVKVDEAKQEIWTVVTSQTPDRDQETCHYETTVPYYKELVDEMSKATDGKNIFPLREMHGLTAAGKGISIEFRDDKKEIYMGFKVVDKAAWEKVKEGVYTGVSQGGRYIKKWTEEKVNYYTAKPIEVSLVDLPCLPDAHFDFVRADGTVEIKKFSTAILPERKSTPVLAKMLSALIRKGDCSCSCANCKDGNCSGCSGETKCNMSAKAVKYLVSKDGENHLPYTNEDGKPNHRLMGAAWAALFNEKGYRGNQYEGPDKAKAQKKLKQLYAKEALDTPAEKGAAIDAFLKNTLVDAIQGRAFGQLGKGMYEVSRLAELTESIKYLWLSLEWEREREGDESPVTDEIHESYIGFLDHLLTYTEEQVAEAKEHEFVY